MEYLINIHPGEILQEKFPKPLEISGYKLKKDEFERINKLEIKAI